MVLWLMPLAGMGAGAGFFGWACCRRRCSLMRLTRSGALMGLSEKSLAPASKKASATA